MRRRGTLSSQTALGIPGDGPSCVFVSIVSANPVIAVLTRSNQKRTRDQVVLRGLFGFTRVEAKLDSLLATGQSVLEASAILDITI
ncbi:MAG TPA: hypothetical protein VKU01_34600 [Bryobacteraceae bacterium]|nr:hypothetical protein [Bryobacteraceae bacterium]